MLNMNKISKCSILHHFDNHSESLARSPANCYILYTIWAEKIMTKNFLFQTCFTLIHGLDILISGSCNHNLLLSGKRKCKNLSKVFIVFQKAERLLRSEILSLFFPVHYVIKKKKISGFGLADIIRKEKFNNFQLDSNLYYQNKSKLQNLTNTLISKDLVISQAPLLTTQQNDFQ